VNRCTVHRKEIFLNKKHGSDTYPSYSIPDTMRRTPLTRMNIGAHDFRPTILILLFIYIYIEAFIYVCIFFIFSLQLCIKAGLPIWGNHEIMKTDIANTNVHAGKRVSTYTVQTETTRTNVLTRFENRKYHE
jgi:hypothetical protein